ncbi:MAG: hypothetical protein OXM55_03375 [Bdellovibrionales bacterium]|nr:hypothetical protein [Bdellovibrionales bacterium]
MKKLSILFLMGLILPFSLLAQGEVIEIDKEDLVVAEEEGVFTKSSSKAEPQVLILNNQNQEVGQKATHSTETSVSHQPVVRVLGTPISTSYAFELKKSRQEAEMQTEQKIVEKLESSRLRDEQERLKKLFNTGITTAQVSPQKTVVVEDGHIVDGNEVYAEVVTPLQDKSEDSIYVGIHGGQSSNLTRSLKNVNSYGSFGVSFGSYDESGLILESSFFYSKHKLDKGYENLYKNNINNYRESYLTDVHQMSGVLSLKYTPFSRRFKPYAGVAISYNYWIYSADVNSAYTCRGISFKYCSNQVKADSVDLGANFGVDFQMNKRVSIGFNMFLNVLNLYNNRSNNRKYDYDYKYDYSYYDNRYDTYNFNPIKLEETNWIIASINAKLYF